MGLWSHHKTIVLFLNFLLLKHQLGISLLTIVSLSSLFLQLWSRQTWVRYRFVPILRLTWTARGHQRRNSALFWKNTRVVRYFLKWLSQVQLPSSTKESFINLFFYWIFFVLLWRFEKKWKAHCQLIKLMINVTCASHIYLYDVEPVLQIFFVP